MVRNKRLLLFCLLGWIGGLSAGYGQAAPKYLILLKDKANSPYTITKPDPFLSPRAIQRRQRQGIAVRERDLPVNPTYVAGIRQAGATVLFTSRWANAVLVTATEAVLATVKALPYVQGVEFNGPLSNARLAAPRTATRLGKLGQIAELPYGSSREQVAQLGADIMHNQGYHGEGMLIGVLDDGFVNANKVPYLQTLFAEKRVVGTYDFADRETNVYNDGSHGLNVLSTMAGQLDNQLYGTAYKASYLLLRTEVDATETPQEEAYWLLGAEYADSVGVDVINSSLGYTTFDELPSASHTYADLTGSKTLVSRAAGWAADAGIVVVVAAGNEGADPWKYISAPADAPNVLAIAAVNRVGVRGYFSSFGPSADGRIKPDLAATGVTTVIGDVNGNITTSNGTSFASPLVAGLAAGFWQAFPNLTALEVLDALRKSGSQADKPDFSLGYGIPNFERAAALAKKVVILATVEAKPLRAFPNPFTANDHLRIQGLEVEPAQPAEATLTDLAGRILFSQPMGSDAHLPRSVTERLAPGFYCLTINTNSVRHTLKLLKQ